MEPAPRLAGAVLCGGRSRCMGSDKAALVIDGQPLLDRAVQRLQTIAHPVIIAFGSRPLVRPGCVSVADRVPGRRPLAGLVAAVEVSPHPLCTVVAVDMPNSEPALLRSMAGLWEGEDAIMPISEQGPEPLHAVYAHTALPVMNAALRSNNTSLHTVLEALRVRFIDAAEAATSPRFSMNLNRREDVTDWRRRARAGGPPLR